MSVGLQLGNITDEVGSADFFHAFFSTVSGNLEPEGWGSRFPIIMRKLYAGELHSDCAGEALNELNLIAGELALRPPGQIIWDIEDRSKMPPWGTTIADTITDLSNYFVTSTGRDLIAIMREAFEELRDRGGVLRVVG